MRRHPEEKFGADLFQSVHQAGIARQIVQHDFAAAGQCGDQGAEAEVMRQRTQRVERSLVQMPVARHHPGGGEQRVVAVHHALRYSSRAGGEGQIHDLVRVIARRPVDGGTRQGGKRGFIGRTSSPAKTQKIAAGEFGENIAPVAVRAVTGQSDQRRRAHPLHQRGDFSDPVVAVQ
jgi:hypothetical protein